MKVYLLFIINLFWFLPCKAQQTQTSFPKIENYTRGDLKIKVVPFGLDDPISVGHITSDGTIHLKFPETHLGTTDETPFYSTRKIGKAVGIFVCHDKEIIAETETATAIEVKHLSLYKYGERVGALHLATQEETLNNDFTIGNKISWFLSSEKGVFKATCITYEDDGLDKGGLDKNQLRNKTTYNINFEKGWNMLEHKLLKTKVIKNNGQEFKRRLIEEKTSVSTIPTAMNWYLKYWANDAALEIEQQLIKQIPITKAQYESWVPKKLGKLKNTSYQIGKKIERMPTLNNIELLFEKGSKKATVTIVDCVNNKNAASTYTLMMDMASNDWKDKTKTGYRTATTWDDTRVIIDYNHTEQKTVLMYNAANRFTIKAEAIQIKPEELWTYLKTLHLETLIE